MRTIYTLIISSFALLLSTGLGAQEETLFGGGKVRVTGIWGGSYNAFTSYDEEYNHNAGGFFTFEFNNDFLLGWTGYGTDLELNDGRVAKIGGSDFLLGYTHNSNKVLHPILYLQMGSGKLKVTDEQDDRVFTIQPNVGLEVNVFDWFRLGVEGGYRFVNNVNVRGFTEQDLSSPVFGVRLKFGFSWDNRDWDD